jgi:hypothetical protein
LYRYTSVAYYEDKYSQYYASKNEKKRLGVQGGEGQEGQFTDGDQSADLPPLPSHFARLIDPFVVDTPAGAAAAAAAGAGAASAAGAGAGVEDVDGNLPSQRKRPGVEVGTQRRCSVCGELGHNKLTCGLLGRVSWEKQVLGVGERGKGVAERRDAGKLKRCSVCGALGHNKRWGGCTS